MLTTLVGTLAAKALEGGDSVGILLTISDLLIPVTVLCIVVFGCLQRMDIYEVFLEGAKEACRRFWIFCRP